MSAKKRDLSGFASVRISKEVHAMAKELADNCRPRSTIQYVVEDAILEYIEGHSTTKACGGVSVTGKARDVAGRDIKKTGRKTSMKATIN